MSPGEPPLLKPWNVERDHYRIPDGIIIRYKVSGVMHTNRLWIHGENCRVQIT